MKIEKKEKIIERVYCCLCGKYIENKNGWIYGNNAEPLMNGRCCDDCNSNKVIPERIRRFSNEKTIN